MIFLIILFSFNIFAQSIECDSDNCFVPSNIQVNNIVETESVRKIDMNFERNISVEKRSNNENKDLGIIFSSGLENSLSIDFSSDINSDSSNMFIMGNNLNTLSINLNGNDGTNAVNAGLNCANKFIIGSLGAEAKNFYESRRANDSSIPVSCTLSEVDYLKETFSCTDDFVENLTSTIDAQRWDSKINCSGNIRKNICLEKEVKLGCFWIARGQGNKCCSGASSPSETGWSCDESFCSTESDRSGVYKFFEIEVMETEYLGLKQTMSDENICNNYFPREEDPDETVSVNSSKGTLQCVGTTFELCPQALATQSMTVPAPSGVLIGAEFKDSSSNTYVDIGQSGAFSCFLSGNSLKCSISSTSCLYTICSAGKLCINDGYQCSENTSSKLDVRFKYYNPDGLPYYKYSFNL